MRVITGTARGRTLKTPEGDHTRPTAERVKEAVFSIIQFEIEGRRVLDLFAGSGQLGIEALSRGATSAVFIESDKAAAEVVRENLQKTRLEDKATVLQTDAIAFLASTASVFDIVFLDPPYAANLLQKALTAAAGKLRPAASLFANILLRMPCRPKQVTLHSKKLTNTARPPSASTAATWPDRTRGIIERSKRTDDYENRRLPRSFDPVTKGHVDVITRTAKMFDKVIVVVMTNFHKPQRSFSAEERVDMLRRCTAGWRMWRSTTSTVFWQTMRAAKMPLRSSKGCARSRTLRMSSNRH
jgi:16S rRNA (guanine(966)-N(2))-methyltransferase RsmD